MAISRAQLLKELLPGLNALFGLEYARYGEEHKEIYETETSERSFEEETKLSGFSAAYVGGDGVALFSTAHPLVSGGNVLFPEVIVKINAPSMDGDGVSSGGHMYNNPLGL